MKLKKAIRIKNAFKQIRIDRSTAMKIPLQFLIDTLLILVVLGLSFNLSGMRIGKAESLSEDDLINSDTGISLIEKSAQMGDLAIVDFKGSIEGKAFDNGSAENAMIALGSGQMIPGFEEGISGHKVGETFSIDLTFPEEYAEEVAGKDVTFEITIKELWRNIGTMHE